MGVSAAAFVLIIAVTGLMLNHTEDFQLDSDYIQNDWILDWYGIQAPQQLLGFRVGKRHVTLMGEHLYLNRREIEGSYRRLAGAVGSSDMIVVAIDDGILLLTPQGEIIEYLKSGDGAPADIRRLGIDAQGRPLAGTSHGDYRPDADFVRWQRLEQDSAPTAWAQPVTLEPQLETSLRQHYRGEILPLERVVLDLHSGRFFGRAGPWVFDAAAIVLILLALSGTWIWLKRKR